MSSISDVFLIQSVSASFGHAEVRMNECRGPDLSVLVNDLLIFLGCNLI